MWLAHNSSIDFPTCRHAKPVWHLRSDLRLSVDCARSHCESSTAGGPFAGAGRLVRIRSKIYRFLLSGLHEVCLFFAAPSSTRLAGRVWGAIREGGFAVFLLL